MHRDVSKWTRDADESHAEATPLNKISDETVHPEIFSTDSWYDDILDIGSCSLPILAQ